MMTGLPRLDLGHMCASAPRGMPILRCNAGLECARETVVPQDWRSTAATTVSTVASVAALRHL